MHVLARFAEKMAIDTKKASAVVLTNLTREGEADNNGVRGAVVDGDGRLIDIRDPIAELP